MPRSAIDATRFTSTTPHATSAKPFYPAASNPGSAPIAARAAPAPPGETPQQKVKRLREAASRARDAKLTTFDKAIVRGRVWADRAHRFTALTLIGITGIAGVVTVYALGDMIIYNRRKKSEYFAEQRALAAAALHEAQVAQRGGTATTEQLALLTSEGKLSPPKTSPSTAPHAHTSQFEKGEIAAAKIDKETRGIWATTKSWLFAGLQKEEEEVDPLHRLGFEATSEEDDVLGTRESDILRAIEAKKLEVQEKAKHIVQSEVDKERKGGPLDRLGTEKEGRAGVKPTEEEEKSGGWTSFMGRK